MIVGAAQLLRERSVLFGLLADSVLWVLFFLVGVLGGSLTIVAEAVRGGLMILVEAYALAVLRRVHRGSLAGFDFGAGKLEVLCNLAIGLGMLGGAFWIAHGAATLIVEGRTEASPLGLALAACLNAVNTYVNAAAWLEVRAATGAGESVIMRAQLRARSVKLVSCAVVQTTLTAAAVTAEPVIAAWADAVGALVVAVVVATTSLRMLREGVPDLLDRAVDETTRRAALRALEDHRHRFADLGRIRSRRSGGAVFLEIALQFDAAMPVEEVDRRIGSVRASIEAAVPGADVAILAGPKPVVPA